MVENLHVSGIKPAKIYYEKLARSPSDTRFLYNCFALVQLAKDDYLEAKKIAMGKILSEAGEAEDPEKKAAAERLFRNVEKLIKRSTAD